MKLSDLPVGSLVKDTYGVGTYYNNDPIIWRVLEHGHSGDPTGSTALECRDIISLKAFDAKEPNNSDSDRRSYGNNRYLYSNLLQWLNSDASSNWYTAQHSADQSPDSSNVSMSGGTPTNPYDTEAGFLTNFSTELKSALLTVSKTTVKNTVTDGGGSETVESKVFLLSTTEVGLENENNIAEGSIYSLYNSDSTKRIKVVANAAACGNYTGASAGSAWTWRLRTPNSGLSRSERHVNQEGSLSGTSAFNGDYGVSPAICISSDLEVALDSTDNVYYIVWPTIPNIKKIYINNNGVTKCIQDNTTKLVSWANGTDEEIGAMIDGYYSGKYSLSDIQSIWNIGDTRSVTIDAIASSGTGWSVGESHRSQVVEFQILDFEHDDLTTPINGKTKALITVDSKNVLVDANTSFDGTGGSANTEHGYINSTNTNVNSWRGSARRGWCNNGFYNALPNYFKNRVKQVNKITSTGNKQTTTETTADYCYLLSEWEIFGAKAQAAVQEGIQYAWYANATANYCKLPKWSSATQMTDLWWERSPDGINVTHFCCVYVGVDGATTGNDATSLARGLAPACSL